MFKKKKSAYKKCPRCGNKCLLNQEKCDDCGLIFSRLQYASNKAAKIRILKFDKDFVIYTNQYPQDVNWFKLLMITFFLGLVGGQYYYVGKYIKGGLTTLSFVYMVLCTIFNAQILAIGGDAVTYFYLPVGIYAFSWIVSLVYVCFKKFKVPVIVENMGDEVVSK